MKILTNKQNSELLELTNKQNSELLELKNTIKQLKQELSEAKDLKNIIKLLSERDCTLSGAGFNITEGGTISFTEDVAIYVDDLLGGKVIKQEGTPCIRINSYGKVKEGLTKEKPDKGYRYKLVRDIQF